MVRFLLIDPMVSGSSPTSAKHSLRVRRVASFVIPVVGIARCGHREEGPGHCSISRKHLSIQISTFDTR